MAKMNEKEFDLSEMELKKIKIDYEEHLKGKTHLVDKHFSVLDLFRYKSLRSMTLILIFIQVLVIFGFFAPILMLEKFHLSLFFNGFVLGLSEFIAYPVCYFTISTMKRRTTAYLCFSLTFISSFILIFVWDQGE